MSYMDRRGKKKGACRKWRREKIGLWICEVGEKSAGRKIGKKGISLGRKSEKGAQGGGLQDRSGIGPSYKEILQGFEKKKRQQGKGSLSGRNRTKTGCINEPGTVTRGGDPKGF